MMIENNPSRGVVSLCFNTIKKLYQNIDNFYGIIECSSDLHLINLIKNQMPNLKVFLGEDKLFIEGVENHLDGFISPLSLTFGKLMKEVIEDYQIGFKNELLISYLKLTHEIIYVYDIPMNIKCYLKKKKFNSMNMRLPLKEISATNQDFDLLI
jgi:dihydrodipicolinate synthase/N-acetylneuraminate lyase